MIIGLHYCCFWETTQWPKLGRKGTNSCVCVCVFKMMINYWGAPMHFWDPKYD